MSEPPIQTVSDTAFMVAAFRALETERPDALFHDPLAARVAGEQGRQILTRLSKAFFGGFSVVIRTVIIDDFVRSAVADGVDTVLNLGAGLDTRPYRMDLPESLRWIEVDFPHVLALKEERLAGERPRCRLSRIAADLTDASARRAVLDTAASGAKGVLVLTEGVVPYLRSEDVAALARDLRAEPKMRGWVVDYFSPHVHRYRQRRDVSKHMQNAPFRFQPADWFGFFRAHGWGARYVRYIPDEASRLGRRIPLPLPLRVVAAVAPGPFKSFAAYVLLEPT